MAISEALQNYRETTISQGGKYTPMAELNKGKPQLDPQEEYVFELIEGDAKPSKAGLSKEDKAAGKEAPKRMAALLTWKEEKSGVLVFQKEFIDKLYWGNSDGTMKSRVIQFLEDIGIPCPKDKIPAWGSVFMSGMHIRARVQQKVRNNQPVQDEYIFKSVRQYRK